MNKRDKKMIEDVTNIIASKVIETIEAIEVVQKAHDKAERKVFKKKMKAEKKKASKRHEKEYQDLYEDFEDEPAFIDISDIRLTPPPF